MATRSYSDIRDRIGRELADLSAPAAREAVVEHLSELTFELDRIKRQQAILLAALRARDILLRDRDQSTIAGSAGPIVLDPRDALDAADGFYDIEWQEETAYRWTGPGHDTLVRVWLDRVIPIVCEIAVLSYGDERNRGAVALTVDGAPVAVAEVADRLLRSEPFPLIDGSLYSEVGVHVPWLSGTLPPDEIATSDGTATGSARRGRRSRAARRGARDERVRGIAVTGMRFVAPT